MGSRTFNIHERFLRHIWSRQYLHHEALKTSDGFSLHVLHAGHLNMDGGPDFRDAVLQIGRVTYQGDVEIHRTVIEWIHHQHHNDPRYNRVILHVVLERPVGVTATLVPSGRRIPVLVLEPFLSESIHTLWRKTILDERLYSKNAIRCAEKNHAVPRDRVVSWLEHLAVERLELKLHRFNERLRELAQLRLFAVREDRQLNGAWRVQGNPEDLPPPQRELTQQDLAKREYWDQLLYEGTMEGLGYSKNREPFTRLARSVTLREFRTQHIEGNELAIQALLLGAAGLLPRLKDVHDRESREFVRLLTGEWKTRKRLYRSAILHPANWQFFPTRPSNFPTLRIAAATVLIKKILCNDLFRTIIETLKTSDQGLSTARSLHELLLVQPLTFWKNHYHFDRAISMPTRALGPERTGELITNTIVPLALLYARTFRDRVVRERTLQLVNAIPPAAGNSITRLIENQLLRGRVELTSVGVQQGVIQLYKYYCLEERCIECAVGEVVFKNEPATG